MDLIEEGNKSMQRVPANFDPNKAENLEDVSRFMMRYGGILGMRQPLTIAIDGEAICRQGYVHLNNDRDVTM